MINESVSRVSHIRLIDIRNRCIYLVKDRNLSEIDYVALSYVWGGPQKMVLSKDNVKRMGDRGSLNAAKDMNRTIADAMELTERLGANYLWVDALCIIQDDDEDKASQIANMATIYNAASVTIVAAAGDNADAGLPGLHPGTRWYQQKEFVVSTPAEREASMSLLTTIRSHPLDFDEHYDQIHEDLDNSVWNTRGWTMQERALSRRNIVFTKDEVLWYCQDAHWREETFLEVKGFRSGTYRRATHEVSLQQSPVPRHDARDPSLLFWNQYKFLVERYTNRNFTAEGDVYDAFSAVVDVMGRDTGEGFLWGLPCSRFELALSWDTLHGLERRTELSQLPMTSLKKKVSFPSWSWMGWKGGAHCWVADDRLET